AEDGIRYRNVTGVQTCALPIYQKNVIKDNMLEHQEDYVVYSPEIRVQKILLHLFSVTEPISSNKLAKKLFVTRRTIVDDLKSVRSEERRVGKECGIWMRAYEEK